MKDDLDYAIGSGLECAACLDLERIKRLLDAKGVYTELDVHKVAMEAATAF